MLNSWRGNPLVQLPVILTRHLCYDAKRSVVVHFDVVGADQIRLAFVIVLG